LKTIEACVGLGTLPIAFEDFLKGNGMLCRDTVDLNECASAFGGIINDFLRTKDPLVKVLGNGLLGGVASEAGVFGVGKLLNNTR
jgi:hypothetical protein